ncbi:4Fe-4S binding protein [Poritiphilus flavus]|uniref:4Fe-4S dicluster domain-containing protein n=1 Tax=Poritiphilus flavus TaxID=2697053 RepID=A0A6L9EA19_9FLAO|nr:4Fe-4S binding protein [Poritiphilus flavus]NAS11576.1 4Fe-4S dicluster domain-containing protein [Poritiphilus flavus]
MTTRHRLLMNGNQATVDVAYRTNELCAIYPITPASEMSELAEEWHAGKRENIYGSVPAVVEMQSESGVAGALHGALQTGSLATTFTASQGLLLMMPNMFRMAGELSPHVVHVATRSVATHALSVFGDHSDIMAVRNTGYAFLAAASVQEAADMALISQAATLASRIPFVHFFDGFRTSHEMSTIERIPDEVIHAMIQTDWITAHRERALNPDKPFIRGTAQAADVFFQSREAVNSFYQACPGIVQDQMEKFSRLSGRSYKLFDYVGHPEAEYVLVAMASATQTLEETIRHLNAVGEKIGLVKVRLFRPFSPKHLLEAIPASCKAIAVLDRTKEPGASGEPLYLDTVNAVVQGTQKFNCLPKVIGGRYGLSSKEFTPEMAEAVIQNLKQEDPINSFTIGIHDDVTHLSLPYVDKETPLHTADYQAIFYQNKSEKTLNSFNRMLQNFSSSLQVQGYTECDYKKSASRAVSHLRLSSDAIKAPYLVRNADYISLDSAKFLEQEDILSRLNASGTLLINSDCDPLEFWNALPGLKRKYIREKDIALYLVNNKELGSQYVVGEYAVSGLHACFLAIKNNKIQDESMLELRRYLSRVDTSVLVEYSSSEAETSQAFDETFLGKLLRDEGNEIPVSQCPPDGTYPSNTSGLLMAYTQNELPIWDYDACTQCGACSMACPQAAIRIKVYDEEYSTTAPNSFETVKALEPEWAMDLLNYTLQVNPDQCNGCANCIEACPVQALTMVKGETLKDEMTANWNHFQQIPEMDRGRISLKKISQQQLMEPLFKYSTGVMGCGEAPYLKLLSQLFGDRALIANATGASSIFGGALPTTPWSKNEEGRGPAWSNSLFEDNAEFGLGFRLSHDQKKAQAKNLLRALEARLDTKLVHGLLHAKQGSESEISQQRERVVRLKRVLELLDDQDGKRLQTLADELVNRSVWIVGGDGWAYDIGYGGLDHVLASGENVNILVMDNEVYSNTGGQMSKATPSGASAKFAHHGKAKQKKDLGLLAMTYDDVYVASVAIGADQQHTLETFLEAESFDGPSLIIAYCHSPAHGIDMKRPQGYHKAAVNSGQWLLYRNDPRRILHGLNPLQLDSKAPSLSLEEYLKCEKRFSNLFRSTDEASARTISQLQHQVNRRYFKYLQMASAKMYGSALQPTEVSDLAIN